MTIEFDNFQIDILIRSLILNTFSKRFSLCQRILRSVLNKTFRWECIGTRRSIVKVYIRGWMSCHRSKLPIRRLFSFTSLNSCWSLRATLLMAKRTNGSTLIIYASKFPPEVQILTKKSNIGQLKKAEKNYFSWDSKYQKVYT